MKIPSDADFNQLINRLNQNLLSQNSFVPHLDAIPNINSKGIYFWFVHPDGYKDLSNIEPIKQKYPINIDGIIYDLVYIGTTGTGKQGNSTLTKRLIWHIVEPHHTLSNICHGTLSTLRAGIGALLSNDLIEKDTENVVNDFMKQYMKVFWIEYPNDNDLIDNDEKILIKGLKPLLNLKNNPNARTNAIANSTQVYKIRRALVYFNTRIRLGCKGESEKIREKKNPDKHTTPIYNHQIIDESQDGCTEYFVLQNQHIGEVTRGIEGLPLGKCEITIFDSNNPNFEFTYWTRKTGNNNHDAQNIYRYFDNTSSNGPKRYLIIQDWIKSNNIKEITVRVCPIN